MDTESRVSALERKLKCICTVGRIGVGSSIEQELEVGLKNAPKRIIRYGNLVTRILLPAAKWEEVDKSRLSRRTGEYFYFHDIPVFSYSGDKTIFCTDK